MSGWEGKEEQVKESLSNFIHQHIGEASLGGIDDIVLSYVVSILEEIGSQEDPEEAFDVEHFTEMMDAYFPGFVEINSSEICSWMFDLASTLSERPQKGGHCIDNLFIVKTDPAYENLSSQKRTDSCCSEDDQSCCSMKSMDEVSDQEASGSGDDVDEQIKLLQEMFPNACVLEVQHCLCIASGSSEKAAQIIIHRQESGESISSPIPLPTQMTSSRKHRNENELREHILSRYMYVDQSEDDKEHKPVAPKWEPKKLVRYRNNQIVTLKGEKYTEVKETESDGMKKTYVTLKPARHYRFH